MSPPAVILMLALIAAVVLVLVAPLRRVREHDAAARERGANGAERDELEAAREAKYREIRESELDYRTGKLSAEDHAAIDAQLRAEALAILDRLERLQAGAGDGGGLRPRGA